VVSYKGPLDNVTLREDTIGISDNGFFSLNETNLILPLGLKYIGNYAFDGCTAMLSLTIPSSVISMGHCAIFACIKLTIYCEATSQPSGWDSLWNPANRPVVWNYKNN
jgi:hypothetical protein